LTSSKTTFNKKLCDRVIAINRKIVKEIIDEAKQQEESIDKFIKDHTKTEEEDA